jgi:hypothetical protein
MMYTHMSETVTIAGRGHIMSGIDSFCVSHRLHLICPEQVSHSYQKLDSHCIRKMHAFPSRTVKVKGKVALSLTKHHAMNTYPVLKYNAMNPCPVLN